MPSGDRSASLPSYRHCEGRLSGPHRCRGPACSTVPRTWSHTGQEGNRRGRSISRANGREAAHKGLRQPASAWNRPPLPDMQQSTQAGTGAGERPTGPTPERTHSGPRPPASAAAASPPPRLQRRPMHRNGVLVAQMAMKRIWAGALALTADHGSDSAQHQLLGHCLRDRRRIDRDPCCCCPAAAGAGGPEPLTGVPEKVEDDTPLLRAHPPTQCGKTLQAGADAFRAPKDPWRGRSRDMPGPPPPSCCARTPAQHGHPRAPWHSRQSRAGSGMRRRPAAAAATSAAAAPPVAPNQPPPSGTGRGPRPRPSCHHRQTGCPEAWEHHRRQKTRPSRSRHLNRSRRKSDAGLPVRPR